MKGADIYKQSWKEKAKVICDKNPEMPFLNDFFIYLFNKHQPSTAHKYLFYTEKFMRTIGATDPTKLKLIDYDRYMNIIDDQTQSAKICAYHSLKAFSNFLRKYELGNDFMKEADRPKFTESQETLTKRQKGYLTKREIRSYISAIKNSTKSDIWKQRDFTIIMIFLSTGIRCAALYKLDISDFDFEEGTFVTTEKGGYIRKVYMPAQTIEEIKKWLEYRKKIETDDDALFVSNRHQRLERITIYQIVKSYAANINGKSISPHKLRATYGIINFDETKDIYFVQKLMGHKSPQTTEIYIRDKDREIGEKSASLMNNYIGGVL